MSALSFLPRTIATNAIMKLQSWKLMNISDIHCKLNAKILALSLTLRLTKIIPARSQKEHPTISYKIIFVMFNNYNYLLNYLSDLWNIWWGYLLYLL